MTWTPRHPAFKNYAEEIAREYKSQLKVLSSREAVKKTAEIYEISETQVYRYLQFLKVKLPKIERKRDEKGRYIS